jgi:vancomycin resistance protein YoaR
MPLSDDHGGFHMARASRIVIIAAWIPAALIVLACAVFAIDRLSSGGEILGGISAGGTRLNGLGESDARQAVRDLEARMASTPIIVEVDGTRFEMLPSAVGFRLDEDAIILEALRNGREGNVASQFLWWLGHFGARGSDVVELAGTFDPALLEPILVEWEHTAVANPAFEGGVTVEDGLAVAQYPRAGTGIDRGLAPGLVRGALLDPARAVVVLPTTEAVPKLTAADIDAAVEAADRLIGAPLTLLRTYPPIDIPFSTSLLGEALRSRVDETADSPSIELYFDTPTLLAFLEPMRAQIEIPPLNAQILISEDDIPSVAPGKPGVLIAEQSLSPALLDAANSPVRQAEFPCLEGAQPEFTTAAAEALGIKQLLYTATTFYAPGGEEKNLNRIHNIHLIADQVNGAIVMPGATFSLNEYVGQRTLEGGYRRAGAIIGTDVYCCDSWANIGGGVSQFTTTMYNAVFFSGLEDIEHTPHSLYIDRYPEGREATLGYPSPDLKFRNNTNAAIYIKTEYTDDSITVKFFGDNGGITVEAEKSERSNFTEPKTKYEGDPEVPPGEEKVTDEGKPGFTVTVHRIITFPDGTATTESWTWTYQPFLKKISVNPCQLPEDAEGYDPEAVCPIEVPPFSGMTVDGAIALLSANGTDLVIAQDSVTVTDPAQVGLIQSQTPAAGEWLPPGSTVTVKVGALGP